MSEALKKLQEYQRGHRWSPEDADKLLLAAVEAGEPDIELIKTFVATSGSDAGEIYGHTFMIRGAVVTTRFSGENVEGSISIIDPDKSLSQPQDWIE